MKKFLQRACALALALVVCLSGSNAAFAAEAASDNSTTVVEQNSIQTQTIITSFNLVAAPGQTSSVNLNLSGYSKYTFSFRYIGGSAAGDAMQVDMKKPYSASQTVVTLSSGYPTYSLNTYTSGAYTVSATNWQSASSTNTVFVVVYGS